MTRRKIKSVTTRGAIALLLLAAAPLTGAAEQIASEHAVKAAIIYKIAKFVSWPAEAPEGNQDMLPICLPAADPIGPALESLAGKTVQGRTITIHHFEEAGTLASDCAILFLSQSATLRRPALISNVANAPVLTIGDSADFVEIGGIVTLEIKKNRVTFAINKGAGDRAGLGISAQLLQLATVRN